MSDLSAGLSEREERDEALLESDLLAAIDYAASPARCLETINDYLVQEVADAVHMPYHDLPQWVREHIASNVIAAVSSDAGLLSALHKLCMALDSIEVVQCSLEALVSPLDDNSIIKTTVRHATNKLARVDGALARILSLCDYPQRQRIRPEIANEVGK